MENWNNLTKHCSGVVSFSCKDFVKRAEREFLTLKKNFLLNELSKPEARNLFVSHLEPYMFVALFHCMSLRIYACAKKNYLFISCIWCTLVGSIYKVELSWFEASRYNSMSWASSSLKSDMEDSLSEETACCSCSLSASSVAYFLTYSESR